MHIVYKEFNLQKQVGLGSLFKQKSHSYHESLNTSQGLE